MLNRATPCPQADTLDAFVRGELEGVEAEMVAAHLEQCHECWQTIEEEPEDAALADDVRWAANLADEVEVNITVAYERLNSLLPDYDILEEIGRGGMGIVFRARHRELQRLVALKILPGLLAAVRSDARRRFRREAGIAARLEHPNIIGVHDFGEVDGMLYYIMPLVSGPSLRDILHEIVETGAVDAVIGQAREVERSSVSSSPSISTSSKLGSSAQIDRAYYRTVAAWVADVAMALDYAHQLGVIHRDIKPSNLLLASDGRLMISDFGLARSHDAVSLTADRGLVGTLRYMSPEQLDQRSKNVDVHTDVYALGATLYELLTFRPMFDGRDDGQVIRQVLERDPIRPRRHVAQVPWELETICLKAVEKDRNRRYESALAFADDLRRWLLDLPIHARRPSLPTRVGKFIKRRKLPVALGASLTAALCVSALLYGGYRSSAQTAAEAESAALSNEMSFLAIQARTDLMDGRLTTAIKRIEAGLDQSPNSLEFRVLRADYLRFSGRYDEAIHSLKEILSSDPDCWIAHCTLSDVYRRIGNFELSEHHRAELVRLKPSTVHAIYLQACAAEIPTMRAIELFDTVLERDPDHVAAILGRAERYRMLERFDDMLRDADRAVGSRPGYATPYGVRGVALQRLDRNAEAVRALSKAIELEADNEHWWCDRGIAKLGLGRYTEAVADATKAIELNPDLALAYQCRAKARRGMGDIDAALSDCNRAIELEPGHVEYYVERTRAYDQAGRWDDAAADCSTAIQLAPDDWRPYQNRAICFIRLGAYKKALPDLTRCIELRPLELSHYAERATIHIALRHNDAAIADLTRMIELDPGQLATFSLRAQAYFKAGRYAESAADLDHMMHLQPNELLLRARRGMAYEMAGEVEKALADYKKVATSDGPVSEYVKLWRHILLHESRRKTDDLNVLAVVEPTQTSTSPPTWTGRLAQLFVGHLSPQELLATAVTSDERAEAHYYIGRNALLAGRPADAHRSFADCVKLKRTKLLETDLARAMLMRLGDQ